MAKRLKRIKSYLSILVGLILAGIGMPSLAAPPLPFPDHAGTVVLDAGHGGKDRGAAGPTGQLEKAVCLNLARKLAVGLESDYRVLLTRSEDFDLDLHQRTAIANHAGADLLISLHTGAGFIHSSQGITIYYYVSSKPSPQQKADQGDLNGPLPWEQIQDRHVAASQALAEALKEKLEGMEAVPSCKIMGARLRVLQGANMPAVLIEIGHITNPATEKDLASQPGLDALSKAIQQGIDRFLASGRHSGSQ